MNPSPAIKALPVSCFIIACNEADRIARTINSVLSWVDEIVVIDSGSSDDTVAIAEGLGARVIFNAWPGFGQQKRFGEEQCQHDWLLNLDADEVVSEKLRDEIMALFASGEPPRKAYGMPVNIVYPGDDKPRPFARDHYCYRLYDRRHARFKDSTLHDSVDVSDTATGHLNGEVLHHSFRSFDDLIRKCDERAAYNATHSKPKSRAGLSARAIIEYPLVFLKYYFGRLHILGGVKGLQFARIIAFYRWVRILRMLERA